MFKHRWCRGVPMQLKLMCATPLLMEFSLLILAMNSSLCILKYMSQYLITLASSAVSKWMKLLMYLENFNWCICRERTIIQIFRVAASQLLIFICLLVYRHCQIKEIYSIWQVFFLSFTSVLDLLHFCTEENMKQHYADSATWSALCQFIYLSGTFSDVFGIQYPQCSLQIVKNVL